MNSLGISIRRITRDISDIQISWNDTTIDLGFCGDLEMMEIARIFEESAEHLREITDSEANSG